MKTKQQSVTYWMALFMGIFLPFAETVRRFHQLSDFTQFFHWFDDYILGGMLLLAAWNLKKERPSATLYMIAAWGIGTGALFLSFLSQVDYILINQDDPGGIFSVWCVLIAKALILFYMIIGLIKTINEAEKSSLTSHV